MKMESKIKEYTSLEAVINLHEGLCARPASQIIKDCKKYDKDIFFINLNNEYSHHTSNSNSVLYLLSLNGTKGTSFKIFVESTDEKAKKQALRLYSALTSNDSYNMDFERFERWER